jgi:hypothetical protein
MRSVLTTVLVVVLAGGGPPPTLAQTGDATSDLALGVRQVEEGELETAVITLESVVKRLERGTAREKDLSLAHLYLSMAHLGLSQWEIAKANMRLAWKNDRGMKLDPALFPPRLLQLYDDIKRESGAGTAPAAARTAPGGRAKGPSTGLIVGVGGGAAVAATGMAIALGGEPPPATGTSGERGQRTDTFPFTLVGNAPGRSVALGPVFVRDGTMIVRLDYPTENIILACVGTASACRPFGGRPGFATYTIPTDFPAGEIRASVYFNTNFPQPPGDVTGTVSFTYTPR